jgi:hypothetical protein
VEPVNTEEIVRVLCQNNERVQSVILDMIERMPTGICHECSEAVARARFE